MDESLQKQLEAMTGAPKPGHWCFVGPPGIGPFGSDGRCYLCDERYPQSLAELWKSHDRGEPGGPRLFTD